ncbi:hypothetical protein EW146_g8394 [Bondarzewia mesenterica]|uniref:Uncharacterized protein n=1 Tax=Bondarzewia mesenterica TaxID=1095465 RepID=A0A4V3XDM9_9AGAM|nr:hypothetical protein EW146_g8394 [Bondarzewia mesenterica]
MTMPHYIRPPIAEPLPSQENRFGNVPGTDRPGAIAWAREQGWNTLSRQRSHRQENRVGTPSDCRARTAKRTGLEHPLAAALTLHPPCRALVPCVLLPSLLSLQTLLLIVVCWLKQLRRKAALCVMMYRHATCPWCAYPKMITGVNGKAWPATTHQTRAARPSRPSATPFTRPGQLDALTPPPAPFDRVPQCDVHVRLRKFPAMVQQSLVLRKVCMCPCATDSTQNKDYMQQSGAIHEVPLPLA